MHFSSLIIVFLVSAGKSGGNSAGKSNEPEINEASISVDGQKNLNDDRRTRGKFEGKSDASVASSRAPNFAVSRSTNYGKINEHSRAALNGKRSDSLGVNEEDEDDEDDDDIHDSEKRYSMEKDDTAYGDKKSEKNNVNGERSSRENEKRKAGNECPPSELTSKAHRDVRQGPKMWDQWGKWSSCTVTCGVGKLTRWRHCVAGGCSNGEKEAQFKTCTFAACREEAKIWDQWGKWSCCSATCGDGKISRWRHCMAGGCSSGQKEAQLRACKIKNCP